MTPEGLKKAARLLRQSQLLVVSTGAGMSQESGIPTFRDSQKGIWAKFDPQELATEQAFRADPGRVWQWYAERRAAMEGCSPHPGHDALVRLENVLPRVVTVTQNIDGLHQRSGSLDVIELHGSIARDRCLECSAPWTGPAVDRSDGPPSCHCGGLMRPDVVWFGEMLPAEAVERAWSLAEKCDVMLVVGTSGVVWPAADLPGVAKRSGAMVIEISPEPTELTRYADIFLEGTAGAVLPRLAEAVATT